MSETFKACFEKLEGLSSEELDRSVVELVGAENRHLALVIAHLAEIARRKAELEQGYRSLFDKVAVYYKNRVGCSSVEEDTQILLTLDEGPRRRLLGRVRRLNQAHLEQPALPERPT